MCVAPLSHATPPHTNNREQILITWQAASVQTGYFWPSALCTTKHRLKCLSSHVGAWAPTQGANDCDKKVMAFSLVAAILEVSASGDSVRLFVVSFGGFIVYASPPGGTMWGYTFHMCGGFPCRNNDANGRASARPLCSQLFVQLRVNSPTLPNSTSLCFLFWIQRSDVLILRLLSWECTEGAWLDCLYLVGLSINLYRKSSVARCSEVLTSLSFSFQPKVSNSWLVHDWLKCWCLYKLGRTKKMSAWDGEKQEVSEPFVTSQNYFLYYY